MPWFKLKLKIWESGALISVATSFKSFREIPFMSGLLLESNALITFATSPGLVLLSRSSGAFEGGRKESGDLEE